MSGSVKVFDERLKKVEGIVTAMSSAVSALGVRLGLIEKRQTSAELDISKNKIDLSSLIEIVGFLDRRVSAVENILSAPPGEPPTEPSSVLLTESGNVLVDDEGNPIELDAPS